MAIDRLLSPMSMGDLELKNRVVMAPMTRSRASQADDCVSEIHEQYYSQRANAGLIITEGTHPTFDGKGYNRTPGICNEQHVAAWSRVTRAVHEAGGQIACQLMHCGRVGHPDNKAASTRLLGPSAIAARAEIFTEGGMKAMPTPEPMSLEDIDETIADYGLAAERCLSAGFDAVELHCASGYLPGQFLASGSNHRGDEYGGSLSNRLRFIERVLDALDTAIGIGRVGLRISPGNPYNDHVDANPEVTYAGLLQLAELKGVAWVHAIRMASTGIDSLALTRAHYSGALIGSDSFTAEEAETSIGDGLVDAVSFGRLYIANPDLVERFKRGGPFNEMDKRTIYGGEGAAGYCDYPMLSGDA
jgi:N-ethylmaleimide reductase